MAHVMKGKAKKCKKCGKVHTGACKKKTSKKSGKY